MENHDFAEALTHCETHNEYDSIINVTGVKFLLMYLYQQPTMEGPTLLLLLDIVIVIGRIHKMRTL
mgnify:CR=1 FL=1